MARGLGSVLLIASQQAVEYIIATCPNMGTSYGSNEVNRFLMRVAEDMEASKLTTAFPGRYKEHVAYALSMIAGSTFTDPPAAVASVYLATRFEFYFRMLSGKLNADGTWTTPLAKTSARAAISDPRLARCRVSSIALAYKVMKLDQSQTAARVFSQLDKALPTPYKAANGHLIADIGDRIEYLRNAAGHGDWGDISAESLFFGLVTAIVFYNQA